MATWLNTVTGLAQEGPSTLWKWTAWGPGSYSEDMGSPNVKGSSGSPLLEEHLSQSSYHMGTRNCTALALHTAALSSGETTGSTHVLASYMCQSSFHTLTPPHRELVLQDRKKQPLVTVIFTSTMMSAQVTSQENYVLWCKNILFLEHHQRRGASWVS